MQRKKYFGSAVLHACKVHSIICCDSAPETEPVVCDLYDQATAKLSSHRVYVVTTEQE